MKNPNKPEPTSPPTFESDYRLTNPGLHRLYVSYAYETMEITGRFTEELMDLSRWPASSFAALIIEAQREEILKDAAWAEAAMLMHAHVDFPTWLKANLPNMNDPGEPHDAERDAATGMTPVLSNEQTIADLSRAKPKKKKVSSTPIDHTKLLRRPRSFKTRDLA